MPARGDTERGGEPGEAVQSDAGQGAAVQRLEVVSLTFPFEKGIHGWI